MRAPDFVRERARALRRGMTQPERTLWSLLRRNGRGLHFRRQHPIGPYILDFYCATAKLCVEVDGPSHMEEASHDDRRTAWLALEGVRVLRFGVRDVEQRPEWVVAQVLAASDAAR